MTTAFSDFVRAECATFPEELAFDQWLAKVRRAVGREVCESDAWDLFSDGCDVEDAVAELTHGA